MIDLRFGRWQDVLADVECDAVICDPPYGARTHAGVARRGGRDDIYRTKVDYLHLTHEDVRTIAGHWAGRCRGWMLALSCSDLAHVWRAAFDEAGLYSFAPVAVVTMGLGVRMSGDGPSSWTIYANAARPRSQRFRSWGALPGAYITKNEGASGGGRGKPLDLMRAIVRDYSRPGDLVCDPFAGYGTTARACASLGRRFVGAECDADAYAEAQRRLADVVTVDVQGVQRVRQEALL